MAKKKKKNGSQFNIKGGVHAGRDVIMGDQINYAPRDIDVSHVATPAEFAAKLDEIRAEIAKLRQQPNLDADQTTKLAAAEKKVAKAAKEAAKPDADREAITETLTDAKDKFELLEGGLSSAVKLGTTLSTVIALALKVFGG